jgi:hypothetical protein
LESVVELEIDLEFFNAPLTAAAVDVTVDFAAAAFLSSSEPDSTTRLLRRPG